VTSVSRGFINISTNCADYINYFVCTHAIHVFTGCATGTHAINIFTIVPDVLLCFPNNTTHSRFREKTVEKNLLYFLPIRYTQISGGIFQEKCDLYSGEYRN
jgi:hypothetical protein